jgi:hypothetical protein
VLPDGGPGLLGGPSLGGGLGGRPVLLRGASGKQISAKNDTKSCGESGGIRGGVMHLALALDVYHPALDMNTYSSHIH